MPLPVDQPCSGGVMPAPYGSFRALLDGPAVGMRWLACRSEC